MDKEMIERIALEVAKDYLKFKIGSRKLLDIYDLDLDDEELNPLVAEIERECAESFVQFLARIDAERGKVATGWFVNVNRDCDPDNPHFQQVAKQYEGDPDTFPLFLSPTIPEGTALVHTEILDRFPEINPSNYDHDDACRLNAWGVELVLAAAQGEQK